MMKITTKSKPLWWHSLKMPTINVGSIVEARVIEKTPKALYLDLGEIGSGIVWGRELQESSRIVNPLKIGDSIKAKIIEAENEKGFIELSLKEASKEMGWGWVKNVQQNNETVTGKIMAANRGGLIIKTEHVQGFLPTSQMGEAHFPKVEDGNKERILEELKKLIGVDIPVKIIDFNTKENKVIFSEKKIEQEKMQAILSDKYKVGDVISGKVKKIGYSGVVLTIDEENRINGFVPLTEVSWKQIDDIESIINIGEEKEAKIYAIENGSLKMSFKALKEDPWIKNVEKLKEGQEVSGQVYKFISIGAMIKLDDDMYGFVHSSEFEGLEKMKESLDLNKEYSFIIESIKKEEKRINLKLKK